MIVDVTPTVSFNGAPVPVDPTPVDRLPAPSPFRCHGRHHRDHHSDEPADPARLFELDPGPSTTACCSPDRHHVLASTFNITSTPASALGVLARRAATRSTSTATDSSQTPRTSPTSSPSSAVPRAHPVRAVTSTSTTTVCSRTSPTLSRSSVAEAVLSPKPPQVAGNASKQLIQVVTIRITSQMRYPSNH
jgi:hypothetical protein